jgi:hypothetical protein
MGSSAAATVVIVVKAARIQRSKGRISSFDRVAAVRVSLNVALT